MEELYEENLVYAVFRDEWCEDNPVASGMICEKIFNSKEKAIEYIKSQLPENAEDFEDINTWVFAIEDSMMLTTIVSYTWMTYIVE